MHDFMGVPLSPRRSAFVFKYNRGPPVASATGKDKFPRPRISVIIKNG